MRKTSGEPHDQKQGSASGRIACCGLALLAVLSVALLLALSLRHIAAIPGMPLPLRFLGEYSQNGAPWQPLSEDTRLNALNGDLVLRGKLDCEAKEQVLHAYLDGIAMSVYVDGEEEYCAWHNPDWLGSQWIEWKSAALSGEELEIRLSNPLSLGNPRAYNDFLDKLYTGRNDAFINYVLYPSHYFAGTIEAEGLALYAAFLLSGQFWRGTGFAILVITLLLAGLALADRLERGLLGKRLRLLCMLSFFAAGMIVLDTPDVFLWHSNVVMNTNGAQLCRMLWMLTLSLSAAELSQGWRRTACHIAAIAGGAFDAGAILAVLLGKVTMLQTIPYWIIVQAAVCLALLIFCAAELYAKRAEKKAVPLLLILLMLLAVAAELINARFALWQRGVVAYSVFVVLLLLCLAWAIKTVPATYRAASRAAAQEEELAQSRIAITLSQIQLHFLYNTLGSIHYLCKADPNAAQKAIDDFSTYLRGNLDSLKRKTPVLFDNELEHIRIYLSLEKIRFDEELRVEWDIGTTAFLLPALTVQPLVENAVKHGVGKKPGGGTVSIASREYESCFEVTVHDDGVGYDVLQIQTGGQTHVGIDNVRSRLDAICKGSLTIESTPGAGTTATVRIPKEGK